MSLITIIAIIGISFVILWLAVYWILEQMRKNGENKI